MPSLEKTFEAYHINSIEECETKDFSDVCDIHDCTLLGKGFFSRAYRVRRSGWVIKEGRWDIDIPLIFGSKNMHGQPLQKLLSPFSYKFLPTKEEAWRQYQEYLLLTRYFGFFDDSYGYYPDYESIVHFQNGLRWNMEIFHDILLSRFGITLPVRFREDFPLFHNFLPREYMGYGTSMSPENKGKQTSYIAQEYIEGIPLAEKDLTDFSRDELMQIYLLCTIILVFYLHTGRIPDTRPTSDPKHWGQWFLHTENIFATASSGIKLVDTRWLWNVDDNFIKRGVIIPELILQSVVGATKKIGKMLS